MATRRLEIINPPDSWQTIIIVEVDEFGTHYPLSEDDGEEPYRYTRRNDALVALRQLEAARAEGGSS